MSSPALNLPTLDRVAVLASGGIDSSVLIGDLAGHAGEVTPIYIRFGLHWERDEEAALGRYLRLLGREQVVELKVFELPLRAVYGKHWSATGVDVPGLHSRDEAVYLPGRNVLQLVQPAIWCHLNGVRHLALATLRNNPFPDATPQFFELLQQALRMATNSDIRIIRPYEQLQKIDVLLRGRDLPLAATWSCIRPVGGVHCGACNKCAERRRAFASASLTDPTTYAADR
jgi:7-cyano-7-deazaguanine synthase